MAEREPTSPGRRRAAVALATLGWFALLLQLGIMLRNAAADGTGMLAAVASLARGALLQVYPYPFIDVRALGYPRVLGNILLLAVGCLTVGLVYVAIDRVLSRATSPTVRA